jgi:hypothetical protein
MFGIMSRLQTSQVQTIFIASCAAVTTAIFAHSGLYFSFSERESLFIVACEHQASEWPKRLGSLAQEIRTHTHLANWLWVQFTSRSCSMLYTMTNQAALGFHAVHWSLEL